MNLRLKINDWIFNKKMSFQRYKKGYSDSDCWGLHYWLGETLPKMIKNLRDMKHGYPCNISFEDIKKFPVEWIESEAAKLEKIRAKDRYEYDLFDGFDCWYLILSRIAYCLEQSNDEVTEITNPYQEEYHDVAWLNLADEKDKIFKKYLKEEDRIFKYRDKMKNEALDLVKKYFWGLWD